MAQSTQHDQAALILELSAASTPNIHSPITSPGSQLRDAIVSIPLVQNIRQVMPRTDFSRPMKPSPILPVPIFSNARARRRPYSLASRLSRAEPAAVDTPRRCSWICHRSFTPNRATGIWSATIFRFLYTGRDQVSRSYPRRKDGIRPRLPSGGQRS